MSDEIKPPMPEQPKTLELLKPPDWAIALTEKVTIGFSRVDARLDNMEANIDLQGDTTRDLAKRMTSLEERQTGLENRQASNSMRVRGVSEVDIKHDAAIASLVTELAEVKAETAEQTKKLDASFAILERLDKVAANPLVRRVAYVVGTAFLTWLAAKGVK